MFTVPSVALVANIRISTDTKIEVTCGLIQSSYQPIVVVILEFLVQFRLLSQG